MRSLWIAASLLLAASWLPLGAEWQQPAPPPAVPQQQPAATPAPVTVVLDPAHGGADAGAHGPSGANESEIVLDYARAARVALEGQGQRVLLTREDNHGLSYDERSAIINGLHDAVFISLHISSTGPAGTARAYYFGGLANDAAPPSHITIVPWYQVQEAHTSESRRLAELVQAQLALKLPGSPSGPSAAAVRQLRTVAAPAIAVEVSSIGGSDAKQLSEMAQPLGEAVARGIFEFRRDAAAAAPAPGGS